MSPVVLLDAKGVAGVYSITCKGKIYVGCSKDIGRRLCSHLQKLRTDRHENVKLQNAFNKHGEGSFEFSILKATEDYFEEEKSFIKRMDSFRSGMNMTVGGEGVSSASEEVVKRRAKTFKERYSCDAVFKEKKSSSAKKQWSLMTDEQKKELQRKGSEKARSMLDEDGVKARNSFASLARWAKLSKEERSKNNKKIWEGKSKEERRASAMKSWESRRKNKESER